MNINDLSTKYLKPLIGVELANFKEPLNVPLRNHPRYLVHILLAHLENIQSWDRFSLSSSNSDLHIPLQSGTALQASDSFPAMFLISWTKVRLAKVLKSSGMPEISFAGEDDGLLPLVIHHNILLLHDQLNSLNSK